MKYHQRRFLRFYDLNRRYSVYKIHQHDVIVTPVVTQFIVDKMKPITYVFPFSSSLSYREYWCYTIVNAHTHVHTNTFSF